MWMLKRCGVLRQTRRDAVPDCVLAFGPPQFSESSKLMRTDQPPPDQDAPPTTSISQGYSGHEVPLSGPVAEPGSDEPPPESEPAVEAEPDKPVPEAPPGPDPPGAETLP